MAKRWTWAALAALVISTRLAHLGVLWVEEAYPLAAASELLRGKALYAQVWFDKPPLFPFFYCLFGAQTGWPLRLAGALFILFSAWVAGRTARQLAGERAEMPAAAALVFFWVFATHSAALALTPDLLLTPFHLGAVVLAAQGRPFAAGLAAGAGLLVNTKAVLVLAACLLWTRSPWLLAGFALPHLAVAPWLAWRDYWQQVWAWGALYSAHPPFAQPWTEGLRRTANWLGFHAALIPPAFVALKRERRWLVWLTLALAGVALGLRFFPRYYWFLLAPAATVAAAGWDALPRRWRWACALLLAVPLVRFGPRYVQQAYGQPWSDLAMFESSRTAAVFVKERARPGDSLLVWGYRPDLFPLTGLPAGTRFLDSQPLTGVLADRHLTASRPSAVEAAARNRAKIVLARPTWILDGLGPYNPPLDLRKFPDLAGWLDQYQLAMEVSGVRIYRLR
jgi:hypothetical protein